MAKTGLLILTQPLQVTKSKVPHILKEMHRTVDKYLYIHIQPSCMTASIDFTKFQIMRMPFTSEVRNVVKDFYSSSADICSRLDIKVLLGHFANAPIAVQPYRLLQPLDIVFVDNYAKVDPHIVKQPFQESLKHCFGQSVNLVTFSNVLEAFSEKTQKLDLDETVTGPVYESVDKKVLEPIRANDKEKVKEPVNENEKVMESFTVNDSTDKESEKEAINDRQERESDVIQTHNHVVLGGTFDRLHTGHKLLLTEGCLLSKNILTVGVTDGDMNQSKL